MPLTAFQLELARLLSTNRTPDSHLAGGAALHFMPNSLRYSNDLDYFHDSVERVASAFAADYSLLQSHGCIISLEIKQPGYIRVSVGKESQRTKIEWSHDSAWRFMPVIKNKDCGYQLHSIDLAVNKVLVLAGRDEPRDFLDIMDIHKNILSLGALCWAGAGKDPGFTPLSLLELLKRRGKVRPEDISRLMLTRPIDLVELKAQWLKALTQAEAFIHTRPPSEMGCLYYCLERKAFVTPSTDDSNSSSSKVVLHYGRPGGIIPIFPVGGAG